MGKPVVPIVVGNREQHETMIAFAAEHGICPVIDATYELGDLTKALHHLESASAFGKIGITIA